MSEERKFDEAAFDTAVAKPNGWSGVADPVAEIRRMRDGDEPSWWPMERKRRDEIDAILTEARNKYTVHECNECDYRKSCDLRFDCDECKTKRISISLAFGIEDDYFTKLLDRIEVAAKRERSDLADAHDAIARLESELAEARRERDSICMKQALSVAVGNAAALRAALKDVLDHAPFATDHATMLTGGNDLLARLRHAYYAPARNCDRFATAKEAQTAFLCDARNTEGLDHLVRLTEIVGRVCDWLFDKAKGKETDNG